MNDRHIVLQSVNDHDASTTGIDSALVESERLFGEAALGDVLNYTGKA